MGFTWNTPEAHAAIRMMYKRLLEREPDPAGLIHHVDFLVRQNRTIQEVANGIGGSPEYFQRWVEPHMAQGLWGTPITTYYRHFLDREPGGTNFLHHHASIFVKARDDNNPGTTMFSAHRQLVHNFVFSPEYLQSWGLNGVPGVGQVPTGGQTSPVGSTFIFCVTVPAIGNIDWVVSATSLAEAQNIVRAQWPDKSIADGPCTPQPGSSPTTSKEAPDSDQGTTPGVAISSWAPNRLDVFVRAKDHSISHRAWDGSWHDWDSVGGISTAAPAAVSWGPNRIDVLARATDFTIAHRAWDGKWSNWDSLEGVATSSPAICSWGPNRLDVFVRGNDLAIWHRAWQGSWTNWDTIGASITSAPAAVSWGTGRIDVVARGQDGALWHRAYNDGSGWADWSSLGGALTSSPTICSWAPGRLDVFARGKDNAIWHRSFQDSWTPWDTIGGLKTSSPAAVSWGPGRIDVIARGQDNALWHRAYNDGSGWANWSSLGGVLT